MVWNRNELIVEEEICMFVYCNFVLDFFVNLVFLFSLGLIFLVNYIIIKLE